jgi:hypothetical protein
MVDRYDEELFLGYVEGTLSHDQAMAFEKQMLEDARLRNLVAHMVLDRHRLRGMPDESPPAELMQRVNERLERQMLLGAPTGEPAPAAPASPAATALRFLVYAALAAMILVCAALFIHTLMPSPLLDQPELARHSSAGATLALQDAPRESAPASALAESSEPTADSAVAAADAVVAKQEPQSLFRAGLEEREERKEQSATAAASVEGVAKGKDDALAAAAPAGAAPAAPPVAQGGVGASSSPSVAAEAPSAEALALGKTRAAGPTDEGARARRNAAATAAPAPADKLAQGDERALLRRDILGESTSLTLTLVSTEVEVTRNKLKAWATQQGLTVTEPQNPAASLSVSMPAAALLDLLQAAQETGQSMRVQMDAPTAADMAAKTQAQAWRESAQALRQDTPMTPMLPLYDPQTSLQVTIVVKPWAPSEPAPAPAPAPVEP